MNKPTLTKKQAIAMEEIKKEIEAMGGVAFSSKARAVKYKLGGGYFYDNRVEANSISDDDFILALYIGYNVEQTPEEKVLEYYDNAESITKKATINYTLRLLGIKIEGVNA